MMKIDASFGALVLSVVALIIGLSACDTPEHSTDDSVECGSAIDWWGRVYGQADSLVMDGCLNEGCFHREVAVSPNDTCDQSLVWDGDWAASACARYFAGSTSEIEVMFALELTGRQEKPRAGDVGKLTVTNADSGEILYQTSKEVPYQGTFDPPCAWASFTFGGVDQRDAGIPTEDAGT